MKKLLIMAMAASLVLSSCKKDDESAEESGATTLDYRSGAYVSNEGAFGSSNGSLSWISGSSVKNNLFEEVNGIPLGDVVQSFSTHNDIGYAIVNNSAKVEVINLRDFSSIATISGCDYPRHFMAVSDTKGYLTNGSGAGNVLIVDLNTYQITGEIAVGNGPERLVSNGQYVFVTNSGGWGNDNTVSVIDPATDQVVSTVEVGDNPTDLVVDANNDVWVMCSGLTEYDENWQIINETESKIVLIDGAQLVTTGELQIGAVGDHVREIEVNPAGSVVYVELNGVWDIPVETGELPGDAMISTDVHSFNVNPTNGDIYTTTLPDYIGNDQVVVYNSNGGVEETLDVGIAPNGVAFN